MLQWNTGRVSPEGQVVSEDEVRSYPTGVFQRGGKRRQGGCASLQPDFDPPPQKKSSAGCLLSGSSLCILMTRH